MFSERVSWEQFVNSEILLLAEHNVKETHLEQVGNNDVLPICPMENVIVEDRLVNVAVRVQRVGIRCLLGSQPVLPTH